MPVRGAITALLLALAAGLSWWLYSQLEGGGGATGPAAGHHPDYYVDDFTVTEMNAQGKPRYRLEAVHMAHYADDDSADLVKPYLEFYRPGAPPWQVRALKGWVSSKGERVRLEGDVHIHRDAAPGVRPVDGYTQSLLLKPQQEYAETSQAVTLISTGVKVQSVGMRAFLKEDRVELLSKVRERHDPATTP